jgi:hypothetical protein
VYKGKKVIIMPRPWYRHPIFPWGWYSLTKDKVDVSKILEADGYYSPDDGGGGTFKLGS